MSRLAKPRISIILTFVICCALIGVFFYAQLNIKEQKTKANLFTLVPQDAQAIIETNNINSLFQDLEGSVFYQDYKNIHFSDLFNFLNHKIDQLAEKKGHGLSVPMSNVLISFHSPGISNDQILYGHLGDGDQNLMDRILKELNTTGHRPKEVTYKKQKIVIYPLNNKEYLSCFFQSNCYAISFQKNLIEAVIDAFTENTSLFSNPQFLPVYKQKKIENTTRLYARIALLAEWTQYDIHIQHDAIYLTGYCYQKNRKGNDYFPFISNLQVPILPADFLPLKTNAFYQIGIQHPQEMASILAYNDSIFKKPITPHTTKIEAFYQFLDNYADTEARNIEFLDINPDESHRVMLIPMKAEYSQALAAWKQIAQRNWKSVWSEGTNYPLYTIDNNRIMKYLLSARALQVPKLTGTLLKNNFLILSDREEDIRAYLNPRNYTQKGLEGWNEYLGNLSQQANFTFFADMEAVCQRPLEFKTMLPKFFFTQLDFFSKFTITIQYIKTSAPLNINIILNYKLPDEQIRVMPS